MRFRTIVLCWLLPAACADANRPESDPILVHAARVRAVNFRFIEPTTTIAAGDTIYFAITNGTHSVHFDAPGAPDSVPSTPATAIVKRRFTTPGTFNFLCSRHRSLAMRGSITVTP